jgi:TolB-like protein/DNA-binding winged helix-turn-helix (wHTH) protein
MTTPVDGLPSNYRFADLTLDVARRCVTRQSRPVELKALDFDLLRFLVESAPNVVNADVLAEKVWGRHFVSPENVAQRVMLLRQSLADDANRPRYIETVRNKGYRLIPVVEGVPAAAVSPPPAHRRLMPAIGAALLFGVGVSAAAAYWLNGTPERPTPNPSSVAVLPFEDLSPELDDAHFAAGMQDAVVNQLTKLRALSVIPVRSGNGAHAIPEIVRTLDVATMLGGSVYYTKGRVRVTPRLVDIATGKSLWSDSYERELSDIFAIQGEIALEVARALSLELSAVERERITRVPTSDARARDLYLMATTRDAYSSREGPMAIAEIEQALAFDPEFKEALVLYAHLRCAAAQIVDPQRFEEHIQLAEQAAHRALALDPELGSAHHVLGTILVTKKDWTGAEAAFQKAMSLNVPAASMAGYALLQLHVGKFSPFARQIFEGARAATPHDETTHRFLAFIHAGRGEWARANELYDLGIRRFEDDDAGLSRILNQRMHWLVGRDELEEARAYPIGDSLNASILESLNDPPQALAKLSQAYAASVPGDSTRLRDISLWSGHFGNAVLALDAMRAAIDERAVLIAYVWLPQLADMRRLPEFKTFLRDIGMVEYWQEYGWGDFCRHLGDDDFECH